VESPLLSVQTYLLVLQVAISVDICKDSRVIDRNECHLYEVQKGVVISELCKVLPIVDECIVSYSI
jgi:hypothetical protein